ncbi:MAG TPA: hypothetical protein VF996_03005 [Candidatus Saccharimonadales bacterium]|jgi:hypothetical protein
MTNFLSQLLDAKEPLFGLALKDLEENSGKHSMDVRLQAGILEKAHNAMKKLGLDHQDTTGPELYAALVSKVKEHDEHLAKQMGGTADETPTSLIPKIKTIVDKADVNKSCWVLKRSVAKEFLRKTPPKNIMKQLGYRSVDSMLKKENLAEVFGALRFAEDSEWLDKFNEEYKTLQPSDFETREIEIVVMPHERWANICEDFIRKKKHNITHLKEMGVILLLPVKVEHLPGMATWSGSLVFHYINEIRLYSAFFKLKQVQPNFGEVFVETLIADPNLGPIMAGQEIHWRVIQRYFGKIKDEYHPEIFEPHVQPEDLHWRKAEEMLYKIDPELKFWEDMDYVALMYDGGPVTFNMMDVAASYTNQTPYEEREIYHFRESLWNEIFIRYMGQKTLEEQVLKQLDNEMITPERLKK